MRKSQEFQDYAKLLDILFRHVDRRKNLLVFSLCSTETAETNNCEHCINIDGRGKLWHYLNGYDCIFSMTPRDVDEEGNVIQYQSLLEQEESIAKGRKVTLPDQYLPSLSEYFEDPTHRLYPGRCKYDNCRYIFLSIREKETHDLFMHRLQRRARQRGWTDQTNSGNF